MFFIGESSKKKDLIYLTIIFIFSIFTISNMIQYYLVGGMYDPDKAIYLLDALKFAGMDYYNVCLPSDIFYSPVICYLTSLLFRLGLVNELAIFIVTAIFGVLCEIGLYVLFRFRFNSLLSFFGVILFGSLSVVLWNIGSGGIDIPSLSISIWVFIFTILALNKNHKFFIIVFPLFTFGFFCRYTVGFILPVIFIYYLINKNVIRKIDLLLTDKNKFKEELISYLKSDEFKYIVISIFLSLIIFLVICWFIIDNNGVLTFFEQSSNTFNGNNFSPLGPDANNSRLYYLKNLHQILFEENRIFDSMFFYSIMTILILGCLIKFKNNLNKIKEFQFSFRDNRLNLIFKVLFIFTILASVIGFVFLRNHLVTNVCLMFIIVYAYYALHDKYDDNLKLVILFLSWFLISFIFASLYNVKVPRYFIPVLPSFIFFIVWGLDGIINLFNNKFKRSEGDLIPVILILLLVVTTCMFVQPLSDEGVGHHTGLIDVTNFIMDHDPDYHSKDYVAYDHHFMIIKWYMKINGTKLRHFETDTIDNMDADYVILHKNHHFKNYHKIYKSKEMYLFAHN